MNKKILALLLFLMAGALLFHTYNIATTTGNEWGWWMVIMVLALPLLAGIALKKMK